MSKPLDTLHCSLEPLGSETRLLHLEGELDMAGAARLRRLLSQREESDETVDYVVDMAGLRYLDSSGVGLLVEMRKRLRRLLLAELQPRVLRVFRVSNLDSIFTIEPSVEAALEKLGARRPRETPAEQP